VKALMSGKALLLLIPAVTVVGVTTGIVLAASSNANFTLTASPTAQTVTQGQTAIYTVTMSPESGFSSAVQLGAPVLPNGVSASFSPTQLAKGSATSATVSLTTTSTTPTGTNLPVTVRGVSGGLVHDVSLTLTVNPYVAPSFSLSATPITSATLPGDTATYRVSYSGTYTGNVALSSLGTLPSGVAVSFSPASIGSTNTSTMTVTTKNNTPSGNYTLTIAGNAPSQAQQTTTVPLNLSGTGKSFTIIGTDFSGPAPGESLPLDLAVFNPNNQPISVTGLTVSVQTVAKAAGVSASLSCTPSDYLVAQFGAFPFTVGAGRTVQLSTVVGPTHPELLPALSMPNSSISDQDGCRGATVTLAYAGAGQGA
jgi:uncharacterized membrane protein